MTSPRPNRLLRDRRISSGPVIGTLAVSTLLTVISTLIISGCSSYTSEIVGTENGQVNELDGLTYYLPSARIHIVGTFQSSAVKSSTNDPTTSNNQKEAPNAQPAIATSSNGPPPVQAAPKSTTTNSGLGTYVITVSAVMVPDPKACYQARAEHDYFADDANHLSINSKGLLSSGSSTNTDETVQILANAMSMVITEAGTSNKAPKPFDTYFDPANSVDAKKAKDTVNNNAYLTLTTPTNYPANKNDYTVPSHDGLLYRRLIPYEVVIDGLLQGSQFHLEQVLLIPDINNVYVLNFHRMPFVTKSTAVTFTDGVPVAYSESVPSPVLGFMGIPKAILQTLIPGIPSSKPAASGVSSPASK